MPRRRKLDRPARARDLWGALHPTLDLHGYPAEEAVRRTRHWIADRRTDGDRVVRIITGRGLHSAGLPVLPSVIEELLRSLKPSTVASYEKEPGGGVFRITLHLAKQPASPEPVLHRHDPELIRLAEESLLDLGVQPTPRLIEIEIRRILDDQTGGHD